MSKRIVVTGGARGIGARVGAVFIGAGARVALLDIRDKEGTGVANALGLERCRYLHCDVGNSVSVSDAFDKAAAWLGGIDVLLNVAGLDRPGTAEAITEADWDLVMNVNAKGAMLTNKEALRHMRDAGGRIINFTSIYGVRGVAERAAYSAAKAAVIGWTKAAARDWGRFNVTVNAIAPIMRTEVADKYLEGLPADERAEMAEKLRREIPMGGRMGDVEHDLAPFLLFLSGPGAAYITGQILAIDGGMLIG